jgi:hypothetical protein
MVDAAIEVCKILQGIKLNPASEPFSYDPLRLQNIEAGSRIRLGESKKGWYLGIFGDETSCKLLAGLMLGVAPASVDSGQLSDALGETLNIISGVGKRNLLRECSDNLIMGLPSFLTGAECLNFLSQGIHLYCQLLVEEQATLKVIVAVREGNEP